MLILNGTSDQMNDSQVRIMEITINISSLIIERDKCWKYLYFNSEILGDVGAPNTTGEVLILKLQCCLVLYGHKHSFIERFRQKCQSISYSESLRSLLDSIENTKSISELCECCNNSKQPEIAQVVDSSRDKFKIVSVMHYGKLCVLEPVMCLTPYYLKYSSYCKVFYTWHALIKMDDNTGMYWDNCSPWSDKNKYQLTKYKATVLQQLNHQLRILYFLYHQPIAQFALSMPRSKQKLVDSCWSLIKKLKKRNALISDKKLCDNPAFVRSNENIQKIFL